MPPELTLYQRLARRLGRRPAALLMALWYSLLMVLLVYMLAVYQVPAGLFRYLEWDG